MVPSTTWPGGSEGVREGARVRIVSIFICNWPQVGRTGQSSAGLTARLPGPLGSLPGLTVTL